MRLLLLSLYALLTLGALTMIYPFVLMVTKATTSKADTDEFRMIPEYWHNDLSLFRKYLVDCAEVSELAVWFARDNWFSPIDIRLDDLEATVAFDAAKRETIARDWFDFVENVCPGEFKLPLFIAGGEDSPLALRGVYTEWLQEKYGTVDAVNAAYTDNAVEWKDLGMPQEQLNRPPADDPGMRDWHEFLAGRRPERTGVLNADAMVVEMLSKAYGNAERLREETGFSAPALAVVTCDDIIEGRLGDAAKRTFFATKAPLRYVTVDVSKAQEAWQTFLGALGRDVSVKLTERMPADAKWAGVWGLFVARKCPLEALGMTRLEESWWTFLRERYGDVAKLNEAWGESFADFRDVRISPVMARAHYSAFARERGGLRWRYLTHNFVTVLKFVSVHGKAMQVTAIYIILMIGTTLTVNPLAAYALSRFRLKESHHILLFLLATMAFPGEVLMIPNLLLIKSFPIVQLAIVALCIVGFFLLKTWLGRRMSLIPSATVAFVVTLSLTGWVIPNLAAKYDVKISVSLMNTFWALILPAMANGYGVFLLKGFFDSLPPELYEAGLIDGAGELRMFWQITLPLCKPIMAVMALGAFTAAYGAFMHAFLVCQDPKMWTLMVFLYEFQQTHTMPMVMASLVVAAVPTLIVFLFCQRVILRGIVIPTFK